MSAKPTPETMNRLDSVAESLSQHHLAPGPAVTAAGGTPVEDWGSRGHEAVMRIPVSVQIVLGSVRMPVAKLMSLTRGSILPLDRKVGDLVDVVVNDRVVARGEVVAIDEQADKFAVSVREVVRAGED